MPFNTQTQQQTQQQPQQQADPGQMAMMALQNSFDEQQFGMTTEEINDLAQELGSTPDRIRQRLSKGPQERMRISQQLQARNAAKGRQRIRQTEAMLAPKDRVEIAEINRQMADLRLDPAMTDGQSQMIPEAEKAMGELTQRRNLILQTASPPPTIQEQFGQETVNIDGSIFAKNPRGWQKLVTPKDQPPPPPPPPEEPDQLTLEQFDKIAQGIVRAKSAGGKSYPLEQARKDAVEQIRFYEQMTGKQILGPVPVDTAMATAGPLAVGAQFGGGGSVGRGNRLVGDRSSRKGRRGSQQSKGDRKKQTGLKTSFDRVSETAQGQDFPMDPSKWDEETLERVAPLVKPLIEELQRRAPDESKASPQIQQELAWLRAIEKAAGVEKLEGQRITKAVGALFGTAQTQDNPNDPSSWDPDLLEKMGPVATATRNAIKARHTNVGAIPPEFRQAWDLAGDVQRAADKIQGPQSGPKFENRRVVLKTKPQDVPQMSGTQLDALFNKAATHQAELKKRWGSPANMPESVRTKEWDKSIQLLDIVFATQQRGKRIGAAVKTARKKVNDFMSQNVAVDAAADQDLTAVRPFAQLELDHLTAIDKTDRTFDQNEKIAQLNLIITETKQAEQESGARAVEERDFQDLIQRGAESLSDEQLEAARKAGQKLADRGEDLPGMGDVFQESEERKVQQSAEKSARTDIERFVQGLPPGQRDPTKWDEQDVRDLGPDANLALQDLKREHPELNAENAKSLLSASEFRNFELWDAIAEEWEAQQIRDEERAEARMEFNESVRRGKLGGEVSGPSLLPELPSP
ncbi:hypothetical protein LCGC14_1141740 [marine sediment metagenome]|uniref:Uncharacterized protein n=1 Tax=marine sediment metagenome TaxID=412755 RepID=A0A0F9Q3T8_9ZZZZ